MATTQPDPHTTYTTHWVSDAVVWSHLGEPAPRTSAGRARRERRQLVHDLIARLRRHARPEANA